MINDGLAYCKDNAPSMMILSLFFFELTQKKDAVIIQTKIHGMLLAAVSSVHFRGFSSSSDLLCLSPGPGISPSSALQGPLVCLVIFPR